VNYLEDRKAVEFEPTDSARAKALSVYRSYDKSVTPMPEERVSEKTIRHRLALVRASAAEGARVVVVASLAAPRGQRRLG
jgi:hypothetical protein